LLADRDVQKLLEAGFNVGSQTASQKASGLIDDAAEKGMIYAYLNTPQPYNRKKVKRTQGEVQGFKEELINQLFRDDNAYKKLSKLFPEGSEWVEFFDLASHSAGDPDHADYYPYQWHGRAEDLVNKIWDEQNGSRLKRDYLSCRMQIEMDGVKYEFEMEKSYSAVLSALIIRNEEDDYWGHSEVEEFDSFVGSIKDRKNHFITVSREGEHAGSVWLTENDGELHYYDEMPNKEGRNEMGPVREKLRKFADLVATRLGYAAAKYDPDGLVELRMNERMK